MDNDFTVYDTNSNNITGDFNNTGVALSAEYGRKNALKNGWYIEANLLHEFGGSYNVTMTDSTGRVKVSDSFNDTWFEYGVGAAFASGKNSHVYFDVERSSGSDFTKDWLWNIGARWSF